MCLEYDAGERRLQKITLHLGLHYVWTLEWTDRFRDFTTVPVFDAPLKKPLEFLDETYPAKTRGMGYCRPTVKIAQFQLSSFVFDFSTRPV